MKKNRQSVPQRRSTRPQQKRRPQRPQSLQWLFVTMIVALLGMSVLLFAIGFIAMNMATGELVIIPGTTGIEVHWVE